MKSSKSTAVASLILLSSLFHTPMCAAEGCPAPSFSGPLWFTAGSYPVSVAVGDLNGDGRADLATTGSVLLGNGDGTFQAPINYRAGTNPVSVAVGDFNGDGKADLVTVNNSTSPISVSQGNGNVSVLLGQGDGTFQGAVNYGAGTAPVSVVAGDFNGDGKLDLVVADAGVYPTNGGVSVLLAKGDGTFQAAVNYSAGGFPRSMATGDFNGDGKLDLAVVSHDNYSTSVLVLLGNGDGTFQSPVAYGAGPYTYSVAVGDFNADGKPDLAVANFGIGDLVVFSSVSVLLGKGDGTFGHAVGYGPGGTSVAVGDFNGDGELDLAVGNEFSPNDSVLLGKGDGTFQSSVDFTPGWHHQSTTPIALVVSDLNGDGRPDLVKANSFSGDITVLLNTCAFAGIHLGVARTNTGLTFSWPLPYAGFILESITSVGSTNWQRPIEALTTNNGRLEVTAPFDQPGRFFRLRKP